MTVYDIDDAKNDIASIKKFITKQVVIIQQRDDTIQALRETVETLRHGVKRRDEIIQELRDQIESLRR